MAEGKRRSVLIKFLGTAPLVAEEKESLSIAVRPNFQSAFTKNSGACLFFDAVRKNTSCVDRDSIKKLARNSEKIKELFFEMGLDLDGNYLYLEHIKYFSMYANSSDMIDKYIGGNKCLNELIKDFIKFFFDLNVHLDSEKTVESFREHNNLLNESIKKELSSMNMKKEINLLGFGLDNGEYEKEVAQFLEDTEITKKVNIFGFDPYATKGEGIHYIHLKDLPNLQLTFDVVIARWALHHVEIMRSRGKRFEDFISCLQKCTPCHAMVLIVEHGFVQSDSFVSAEKIKLYYVLNAIFDVLANIALRPAYFMDSHPKIGDNFYIKYLSEKDIAQISRGFSGEVNVTQIGPAFPNQTIIKLSR